MDLGLELYRKMFLIRSAEQAIQEHYSEDTMKTPMHMSMGEEAIVVGVCQALEPSAQVLGSYRSHGLYLAKTGETDGFFAEMYGKVTGVARGKAGSMHLSSPGHGLLCSSAIVAGSIPVALGAAFANKYKRNEKIVAVFFGDGALDEGAFWESINFACLKNLPILFICEDNGFAVHTGTKERQGYESINNVLSQFNLNTFDSDTTDVETIHQVTKDALSLRRKNDQPCFLRFQYYRYLEHVGINEDFDSGYRDEEEFRAWWARDPLVIQREKLLRVGVPEGDISRAEHDVATQIVRSLEFAERSRFSDVSEAFLGVFE